MGLTVFPRAAFAPVGGDSQLAALGDDSEAGAAELRGNDVIRGGAKGGDFARLPGTAAGLVPIAERTGTPRIRARGKWLPW